MVPAWSCDSSDWTPSSNSQMNGCWAEPCDLYRRDYQPEEVPSLSLCRLRVQQKKGLKGSLSLTYCDSEIKFNFWEKAAACLKPCHLKKETSMCSLSLTFMPADRGELNLVTQAANKGKDFNRDFLKVHKFFTADGSVKAAQPAEWNVQMMMQRVQFWIPSFSYIMPRYWKPKGPRYIP